MTVLASSIIFLIIVAFIYLFGAPISSFHKKNPRVLSVSLSPVHEFSKDPVDSIKLIEGLGVEGDAHYGKTVQHLFRLKQDPEAPNLRQVHLIQHEILQLLDLKPCDIGENVTTEGINLLALGTGTKLHFIEQPQKVIQILPVGDVHLIELIVEDVMDLQDILTPNKSPKHAVVEITGLRNPCYQIDKFRKGLKERFIVRDKDRNVIGRKSGVMAVVSSGGSISKGMQILIEEPENFQALECV